jgi:hypothetical protein
MPGHEWQTKFKRYSWYVGSTNSWGIIWFDGNWLWANLKPSVADVGNFGFKSSPGWRWRWNWGTMTCWRDLTLLACMNLKANHFLWTAWLTPSHLPFHSFALSLIYPTHLRIQSRHLSSIKLLDETLSCRVNKRCCWQDGKTRQDHLFFANRWAKTTLVLQYRITCGLVHDDRVINPALRTRKVSDFLEAKWMKRIPSLLEQTLSNEKVEATVLVAGRAFYVSFCCRPKCHAMWRM